MKIITGMHRTGTSMIARLFFESGADMGDPETFYHPDRWNPEGYFEQPDIHRINMPLINGVWWKLAYFHLPSETTIIRRAEKMESLIRETASVYDKKIIKETRFCLTMPAWQKYGAEIERVIICLRDPIQVARSIQKRNFTTIFHGYYLWKEHYQRILKYTENIPIWFVYYQNFFNPEYYLQEMQGMYDFMGQQFSDNELNTIYRKCVNHTMAHNQIKLENYPQNIQKLWDDLKIQHKVQYGYQ